MKILELIESEAKKHSENFDNFFYWLLTGIDPRKSASEIQKDEKKFYGVWKSLYFVIFKKGRIEKK